MKFLNRLTAAKYSDPIFFLMLLAACLVLSWVINFSARGLKHPPEIYSDKADYYVYLPATFIYNWNINSFPGGIDTATQGFTLDKKTGKLMIKATCGVAILVSPFFLITHLLAVQFHLQPDGFSDIYQKMTIFPGVIYLVLGLFFLRKFLSRYIPGIIPYIVIMLVFAGTNLLYYSLDDCLMSHVYSFFLFSLFLFLLKKFLDSERKSIGLFMSLSFVFAFAVLIRPTNILLLLWMVFLDVRSLREAWRRMLLILKPRYLLVMILAVIMVYVPQFIYWEYLTGNFLYYSYPGETFSQWKDPRVISLWFAPLNGLFLYSPLVIFFVAGSVYMIIKKIANGIFTGLFFLLISYIFASWCIWFFGGSFGSRPFVEYYSLLALPFAYLLSQVPRIHNLFIRSCVIIVIAFCTYYSILMNSHTIWNTSSTWAWDDYLKLTDQAGLYHWTGDAYTYIDDFENSALKTIPPQKTCVHSPTLAGYVDTTHLYSDRFSRCLGTILNKPVKKIMASLWMNPDSSSRTGAIFSCSVEDWRQNVYFYKSLKADEFVRKPFTWSKIEGTIYIPEWVDQTKSIVFFVQNVGKKNIIYIDDIRLKFE